MKKSKIMRAVTLIYAALAIGAFVYSLGFFTNFVQIRSADRNLYDLLQLYNRKIFNYSLAVMLGSFVLFIVGYNHGNRNLSAKIIGTANGLGAIWISYFVLQYLNVFKTKYLTIDVEAIQLYYPDYQLSTFVFDFGFLFFVVFAVFAVLLIINSWLKPEGGK